MSAGIKSLKLKLKLKIDYVNDDDNNNNYIDDKGNDNKDDHNDDDNNKNKNDDCEFLQIWTEVTLIHMPRMRDFNVKQDFQQSLLK